MPKPLDEGHQSDMRGFPGCRCAHPGYELFGAAGVNGIGRKMRANKEIKP
jgi:hypothetical protein